MTPYLMFLDWLDYIFDRLNDIVTLILSNWLLSTMFGIHILLFIITAYNVNKDRMDRKGR